MFSIAYKHMFDQVVPNERLISATIASKRVSRKSRIGMPLLRKPAMAGLALVLLVSIPALSASVPAFYEMLYSLSPATAQFFKPVQKSCVDNGIKMEVISACVRGDTAEVLITLQDLTENRLDASTDLFDSYSVNRPFDSSATCRLVSFDEESCTAMFLVSITEWGNQDITGEKITFSFREFISHKQVYDGIPMAVNLSGLSDTPLTMLMPTKDGYGGSYDFQNNGTPAVLVPASPVGFDVDGIEISGMGFVEGMLHIQTVVRDNLRNDNHGYFYFKDMEGNTIKSVYSISFNEIKQGERLTYSEMVFEIPQSELDQYKIYGYFVIGGSHTKGYWHVTFPFETVE